MGTVCKKLHFGNNWEIRDPRGKKGGLLIAWKDTVRILEVRSNDFCIKVHVESEDSQDNFVAIFVHTHIDAKTRQLHLEELKNRKHLWGEKWVIGEDFEFHNNIKRVKLKFIQWRKEKKTQL